VAPATTHPSAGGGGEGELDVAAVLEGAADAFPARLGFDHPDGRWTYREAASRAARLAARLRGLGVAPGEAVAWLGDNGPEAALAYFGAAWAGAVLVPLHLRATDADLLRVLDHAGARVLLAGGGAADRAGALRRPAVDLLARELDAADGVPRVPRAPDTPAHLYYTSGSTGTPKGVVLTHRNVVTHARLAAAALELSPDDVWLHAAPMFHLADAWATFAITLVGGTHRFVRRFDEVAVLDAFEAGATVTNLVPTMWNALVRHPAAAARRWPSLRLLLSGGAAVSPDLVRRIRSTFLAEYAQTYGLTETSPYLTISRLVGHERALDDATACRLLARAGRPMPGVEVAVLGADGDDVPVDGSSVGEVVARGPTVTPGYLRNPAADAAAFRDGWFRTGDLARRHEDGRIELVDRTGDVVNSGGEKVFSTDVERALADAPGVREVVVVGTADPHWGQAVTAVVVADGAPPTLDALRAHARGRLADFKAPRRLVVVDAIPRTASGKVSKREARALAESALARTVAPGP
jgi:fatty-acyl-CoA synthase